MAAHASVNDIPLLIPAAVRHGLRVAGVRRANGGWTSAWRHSRLAVKLLERQLIDAVLNDSSDTILEIGDIGEVHKPYFVLQDLSYGLLMEEYDKHGSVPHFRTLRAVDFTRLRDRQFGVYESATGIFAMSQWLADHIARAGFSPDKIHVVNPGTNAPLDHNVPLTQRRRGPTIRLLFVGRDFDTKGGDQVVAAFRILRRELGPQITLTIVGPRMLPPAGLGDGIDFLGPVAVDQLQSLYDSHDLFVLPSRFEGFGIAFVEALSRGLPCIGRRACAMPEIIDEDSGGRLIDTDEPAELALAIYAVLEDDGLYQRCEAAARLRQTHYTWDRAAGDVVRGMGA